MTSNLFHEYRLFIHSIQNIGYHHFASTYLLRHSSQQIYYWRYDGDDGLRHEDDLKMNDWSGGETK